MTGQQASNILRLLNERNNACSKLNKTVDEFRSRDNPKSAIDFCQRSLRLANDLGDMYAQGVALIREGALYHDTGELEKAAKSYREGAEVFHTNGNRHCEGVALLGVGMAYHTLRQQDKALQFYQKSYQIFLRLSERSRTVGEPRRARLYDNLCRGIQDRVEHITSDVQQGISETGPLRFVLVLGETGAGDPVYTVADVNGNTETDKIMINDVGFKLLTSKSRRTKKFTFRPGNTYFALDVRGSSMIEAGILDGDRILVRRQPKVEQGEIAVVQIRDVDGAKTLVKRFRREGDRIYLESENPRYRPRVFTKDSPAIKILGKVIAVMERI